jgi:hypothetical protein
MLLLFDLESIRGSGLDIPGVLEPHQGRNNVAHSERSCEKIACINHGGTEERPFLFSSQCLCVSVVRALFGNSFTAYYALG